ncbi:DNA-binding domain-containing protein [Pandoravirus kuranda]|uniref:DNA-binding domain-containing protein n=1 Tax=Pandoravirus kuranda TaxID=3019033 RepID=A0AA95ED87_9VIRU|nr:DNA-binding domain-containing protein [Pandoravirus kuranda]
MEKGHTHDTTGSAHARQCAWSAQFEAVVGPERPYVPRAWLMADIARVAAEAGMPPHACAVAAIRVRGEPDQARAPGWPFVDRRVTLVLFADRPGVGSVPETTTTARAMGRLGWRRVSWTDDQASAWARAMGTDAHGVMAGGDYDETVWAAPMAAYMIAVRDHAKLGRPRPARPAALGAAPHGRMVIAGWLGPSALADSAEGLALHLGTWPSSAAAAHDGKQSGSDRASQCHLSKE